MRFKFLQLDNTPALRGLLPPATIVVLLILHYDTFAQEHTHFVHGDTVRTVAYSPVNSSLIASAGESGLVKLWHLRNDTVTTLRGHTDQVNAIAFSPNGQLLVSGSDDYTFKVWDVSRHREIESLQHRTDNARSQIKAVAFSPNGQQLATAGVHVKLWNTRDWNEVTTLLHDEWVWTVAFSPDGRLLAAGEVGGSVKIWNVQRRQILKTLEGDTNTVYAVAFSPDNHRLATAGYDGKVTLWRRSDWERLGTLAANGTIFTVDFSPDSKMLASTGYESVNLWAVSSGENIATPTGHAGWVNAASFSPNNGYLATGGEDETLRLWDVTPYQSTERDMVRLIYFLPRGRTVQDNMWPKLDTLIRDVQRFYANQMGSNGFGRKTFTFETDGNGETLVWQVDAQFNDRYYHTDTRDKVHAEIDEQFDMAKHVYLIVVDISSEFIGNEDICGVGGGNWLGTETRTRTRGGYAVIPASGHCFDDESGTVVTAHELGHAFGLDHDFRDEAYIMSYGVVPNRLSKCAAEWLDVNRFFNTNQTAFNEPTTFHLLSPLAYSPNARDIRLQFEITDADGLHQAQLLIPTTADDPAPGTKLHNCKRLHGQNRIVEFVTTELTTRRVNNITLQVIDVHGNITRQDYVLRADDALLVQNRLDVNGDGTVDVADLVLVASNFGKSIGARAHPNPDVNSDGIVDITDLMLVASELQAGIGAAPEQTAQLTDKVQKWLDQAMHLADRDATVEKGIAVLEHLLAAMVPTETRLLANYPNPFNPETWIPYQLAKPGEVTLRIYCVNGALVRTLVLGHQTTGVYHSKSRAAYWDGRNASGEPVASGVYFYTLSAGGFTATRNMLIQK